VGCDFHIGAEGLVEEVDNDVFGVGGCDGGGERVGGGEVGSEVVEGERGEVAAVKGVGVEVEDSFAGGRCGGGNDGFR